jgi:DNA-binding response OmpR family regulator
MVASPKARILIVEDEKGIRNLLSYELSLRGYHVDTAGDGEEGLEKVRNERYDLIVSDIIMPKMNGLVALKHIKKISPETEVIIITGYATIENALQAMRDGAYDFVQKPFNLSELFAIIEKALEKGELKTLVAVYESSQAVYSSLKLEDLLPVIIKLLKEVMKGDEVALLLYDHTNQLYLAASSFAMSEYQLSDFYIALGARLSSSNKLHKGACIVTLDPAKEPALVGLSGYEDLKALVAYPIALRGRKFGALFLARRNNYAEFSQADLRNLSIFVTQITQSIANTKLYEQLQIKISELENANKELEQYHCPIQPNKKSPQ